jgi:site-specific recombinase XerD
MICFGRFSSSTASSIWQRKHMCAHANLPALKVATLPVLQPAARRAGITKRIGWHTFRHTYSSLLSEYGNDVKVVQELMRHAKISTTMEIYTHARMVKKREAQSKVVDALFLRERMEMVAS